jgi:Protein phosphatase 2C
MLQFYAGLDRICENFSRIVLVYSVLSDVVLLLLLLLLFCEVKSGGLLRRFQVAALVKEGELYVANAGDSRCVFSRRGRAMAMTTDHKPTDPEELARITKVGALLVVNAFLKNSFGYSLKFVKNDATF